MTRSQRPGRRLRLAILLLPGVMWAVALPTPPRAAAQTPTATTGPRPGTVPARGGAPATAPAPATTPGPSAQVGAPRSPSATPPGAPPARAALPPARSVDAILADVVTAIGGAAALARHRSLHTKMEITFKGLGITGLAEHHAAAGDKALTLTSIPDIATTREGSDGTHFWSEDPINGLRLLEGCEADQARLDSAWNAELRTRELFAKVESKNELADDGTRLECLILTPKTGTPTTAGATTAAGATMTECFDAKTHLLAIQRGVKCGPQGDMPFTARLSDWRAVGDMKMAHATEMQVGPLAFTGRVVLVELDVPADGGMFAVPKASKSTPGHAPKGKTGEKNSDKAADKNAANSAIGNDGKSPPRPAKSARPPKTTVPAAAGAPAPR